jgi:peptidoglycan/xylan/chitin deacetylase (PgdA/CDA1 family)
MSRKGKRRRSALPFIVIILAVILIALTLVLVNRLGLVDLGGLVTNAKNVIFKKDVAPVVVTEEPVETAAVPTPAPTPTPTPFPEPSVENSSYRFSAGGKAFTGSVVQIKGTGGPDYVKLTELASFLGSQVSRDASGKTFSLSVGGDRLVFYPGEPAFTLGSRTVSLTAAPILCSNGNDLYVPVEDVLSALYPAKSLSTVTGEVEFSDFDPNFTVQTGRQIPIMSYYNVGAGEGPDFRLLHHDSIIPEEFTAQMKYIHDNGFTTMTFEDLANLENIEKPVMLTFDGCFEDVYNIAFPVMKQYNIKATLFVWPDYIGQSSRLTEHQLKEMASSELISVQAAMETYTMLDYLSMDELTAIVSKAKTYVNTLTGRDPLAFAYSVGSINTAAKDYCASQFRFCVRRSSERPYDTSKDDGSLIYRYTIVRETPLENFALWLSKSK